jgi:hypothetical protein
MPKMMICDKRFSRLCPMNNPRHGGMIIHTHCKPHGANLAPFDKCEPGECVIDNDNHTMPVKCIPYKKSMEKKINNIESSLDIKDVSPWVQSMKEEDVRLHHSRMDYDIDMCGQIINKIVLKIARKEKVTEKELTKALDKIDSYLSKWY